MKKIYLLLAIILATVVNLNAQQPPCYPQYNGLTFKLSNLDYVPPITLSMPYDVILGYLALDTLRRYANPDDIKAFFKRQSYNDTMRYIMKHYYKMVDFDPIKYKLTLYYPEMRYIFPVDIDIMVLDNIERVSPYPLLDGMLFRSHIISHILVTDTIRRIDTSSQFYPTSIIVTAQVIDTIKGKVIPHCNDYINYGTDDKNNKNKSLSHLSDNCIQFQYRLEWERGSEYSGLNMLDSLGNPWIKKDQEYIVFLEVGIHCSDSINSYLDLTPFVKWSLTCTMYPIINGLVYDPGNEFGFGTNLSINEFKSLLRSRIYDITNYSGE